MTDWDKLFAQTECDLCHKEMKKGDSIIAQEGKYHFACWNKKVDGFIAEYEWEEYKTSSEPEMVCPYCGYVNNDSFEYSDDNDTRRCGRCDREFEYSREIEVTYSTKPREVRT